MKIAIILLFASISNFYLFAQPYKTIEKFKPYKWMVGIHWNAVEDDGKPLGGIFNFVNSWNMPFFPSKLTVDRYFDNGWSIEGAAAYNRYKAGKQINNQTDVSSIFLSFDVVAKKSFYMNYYPSAKWIDPYISMGVGYTYRSTDANVFSHAPSLNVGPGLNFWISDIGIQLQSYAKFGLYPGFWSRSAENYLHHSIGVVYRFSEFEQSPNDFDKRRYPWAKKKKRFKKKEGH